MTEVGVESDRAGARSGAFVAWRLLGPLEVRDGSNTPIDVGSPRHRETLAALLVDAGRVVSTDALLERVWGESGRGGTLANLQAVISRLRARLREAGIAAEIHTVSPGYRLDVPPGSLDADRLAAGTAEAHAALAAGDLRAAQQHVADALAWWRGAPLGDVPQPFARAEALRLEGLRLTAEELAADLDIRAGAPEVAATRLVALAREHPLRESVRGELMRALYLAGRQAEALEEYAGLRTLLVEELGVDPSPAVQRLHQQILAQDPALRPDGAVADGPPAATAPARRPTRASTLPSTDLLGELVGRERDVDYVLDLLRAPTSRLITVTGVGGCGKTRLSLAVGRAAEAHFADGVTLVPLAPLRDPMTVIPAIANAVGIAEGGDPFVALVDLLRDRRQLLLLDNAEHLLDAWPEVATLAAACPGLRILVTSRTPLRVRGEALYPLSPLDPESAAQLFVVRARDVHGGTDLDPTSTEVEQLCHRLAGIPLAIELAAARTRLLPPAAILARLDEVMVTEGARDLPPRQRTMRAALEWSRELLSPTEQAAFARLSVFAGGFDIDAAEAVLVDVPGLDPAGVLGVVDSLVEHSLVVAEPWADAGPRFRLLEPVRQFAATQLDAATEADARDAHLAHYAAVAAVCEPSLRGPGTVAALARLQRDQPDLLAAIDWAVASGRADAGGWLGWDLWLYWWIRGALRDGRRRMEAVLAAATDDRVRVRAGAVVGALSFAQDDMNAATTHWEVATALAEDTGDIDGLPYAYGGVGLVALAQEDLDLAAAAHRRNIGHCEAAGLGGEWLWTLSHVWLGTVELLRGDTSAAAALVATALDAGRRRHDPLATYIALFTAIQIAMTRGEPAVARSQVAEGVRLSVETGDHANLAYLLEALAVVESLDPAGDARRIGILLGATDALRTGSGSNVYGYYRPDPALIAAAQHHARGARGASYDSDVAAGRALSVEDMAALAL